MTHARQVILGAGTDKYAALFAYVGATALMLSGAYLSSPAGDEFVVFFGLAIFFVLGPLGVITFSTLALPIVFVLWNAALPSVLGLAIVIPLSVGTALLNVVVVFGWIAHLRSGVRVADRRAGDTVLGRVAAAVLFVVAGFVFIVLCVVTGYLALNAGQGTAQPGAGPYLAPFLFAVWLVGLAAALGGLVLWVLNEVRGRGSLSWALADALLQLALLATLLFGSAGVSHLG
ncbi:hypothetical protein I6E68_12625 [Salinibacterium sp. NSLL150]|uniref:hypothetical protein n=1 Tax=Salinibacterium sp. NSLL150 TaxID=2792042 RepID=UPI0018CD47DA|nr:hypothetical protein [Salinibacterium sp. NSLL150]MBH0099978.1 hypothetical protein [Salinibacterium sp. NSLL35]MBH0102732.1 hypothetical protein [Salinibacterium sp. NSLL150]